MQVSLNPSGIFFPKRLSDIFFFLSSVYVLPFPASLSFFFVSSVCLNPTRLLGTPLLFADAFKWFSLYSPSIFLPLFQGIFPLGKPNFLHIFFVSSLCLNPNKLPATGSILYPFSLLQASRRSIQCCSLPRSNVTSAILSIISNKKECSPYLFHAACK